MDISKTRVLIAEDHILNALSISMYLNKLGCYTEVVENGKDLINSALKMRPDVIMLDYNMPYMDGEEAMQLLKTNPQLKDIPIIATSGEFGSYHIDRLMAMGADAYLVKPINSQDMQIQIGKILKQSRDYFKG